MPLERAVWLALACPLVAVHLVSGAHNDAVMVGLLVAALAVVGPAGTSRSVLVAAGALFGLAIGIKATAVVVLPFAVSWPYRPESSLKAPAGARRRR